MKNILKNKVVFISGKITNDSNYFDKFMIAENKLKSYGCIVLNPIIIPPNMKYESQMAICFSLIDQAEYIYMLKDYKQSKGSQRELYYAQAKNKKILFQEEDKQCKTL